MSSVTATLNDFPSMLSRAWVWGRRLLWTAGAVAATVVLLEAIRLHQLLDGIHPALAWTVTAALGALLLYGCARAAVRYFAVPSVITPPDLPAPEAGWDDKQCRAYVEFAARYLKRQRRNPHLDEAARNTIDEALRAIAAPLPSDVPAHNAPALSERVDREVGRVVAQLDETARRLIRRTAVEVAVATAVSPSILLDSLITLSRNLNMISRLADLYYGRPGLLATLRIARDVLGAALAAGALEVVSDRLGSALSELTGSWSSRFLGPLGQGAVNGVVTMRIGAAARARCRSLASPRVPWRPWRISEYRRGAARLLEWASEDVGPLFTQPFASWFGGGGGGEGDAQAATAAGPAATSRGFWSQLFGPARPANGAERERPAREKDPLLDSDLLD